jgi:hypothetical protein
MQVSSALELLRLSVKMENLADGSHGERDSLRGKREVKRKKNEEGKSWQEKRQEFGSRLELPD